MNDATRLIEQVTWVTPFGVRFWDSVSGRIVGDGLNVTAYRTITPNKRIVAFTNHSGVYVLRNVPGLRAFEQGTRSMGGDQPRSYVVEVLDSARRFQPFCFTAMLPTAGLFTFDCSLISSPLSSPLSSPIEPVMDVVPLHSSPTRTVSEVQAVVRAQIWNDRYNMPAAWAVLEVFVGGAFVGSSYADGLGRVAVFFPYPAPENFADADDTSGSFVGSNVALAQQQWKIQIQVAYALQSPVPSMPDLCTVLAQPPVQVWDDAEHTQPFSDGILVFGQELILRSSHIGPQTPPSVLLITSAA